jgi:hypothetical protein
MTSSDRGAGPAAADVPVGLVVGARNARHFEGDVVSDAAFSTRQGYVPKGSPALRLSHELTRTGKFWEELRRGAHADLRSRAEGIGTGVLARVHWSQLERLDPKSGRSRSPPGHTSLDWPQYVGRHVVIGTVVKAQRGDRFATPVASVIDMCDGPSPLTTSFGLDEEMYAGVARRGSNE